MKVAIDEVFYFDVITASPTTGAATDADSTPTFEVFEESTDTDIGVGGNLTKRTSKTGNYRGSFTASSANGFEAGKWYSVIVSATVGAVAGKATAAHFQVVPAEASAGVPKVDVGHWLGQTVATPTVNGVPEVDITHIGGSSTAATRLALTAAQMIPGTVDNSAHTPTTTEFEADDITEATADHYNGRIIIWTSGALAGQATSISDYAKVASNGHFTVVAMTEAPANNDTFIIV